MQKHVIGIWLEGGVGGGPSAGGGHVPHVLYVMNEDVVPLAYDGSPEKVITSIRRQTFETYQEALLIGEKVAKENNWQIYDHVPEKFRI